MNASTPAVFWALLIIVAAAVTIGIIFALVLRKPKVTPPTPPGEDDPDNGSGSYNINTYSFNGSVELGLLAAMKPPANKGTGLALSGGGSRALSCAMGQLRGLKYLGLLDDVRFISGVSGGAWASSLFTFLPQEFTVDNFLGTTVPDPGDLTWDDRGDVATALDLSTPNNLGQVPQRLGIEEMLAEVIRLAAAGVPENELWVTAVGTLIFEPYNLYDKNDPKYFSYSESWVKERIQPFNPTLPPNRFYLARSGRPYLVVNFNLIPKYGKYPLIPMESTPMITGMQTAYPGAGQNGQDIGGGYIDPFGFDSTEHALIKDTRVKVNVPDNAFSVHTMAGLSSAAFAETLQSNKDLPPFIKDVIPRKNYWPVMNLKTPAYDYHYADGGNLEDTGIVALLRRGLTNVISFVNGSTQLELDTDNHEVIVGGQIPPLFGYQPKTKKDGKWLPYAKYADEPLQDPGYATYQNNQVFKYDDFWTLIRTLWAGYESNGTAMCQILNMEVLDQPYLGVSAYQTNKVLWVYNNEVTEWREGLRWEVREAMDLHPLEYESFPGYGTITQLHLSPRQVNLLAHLSCWNVISESTNGHPEVTNRAMFQGMFD